MHARLFRAPDNDPNPAMVVTGRNMDWGEDMMTDMWAFPKGMKRVGGAGPKSLTWMSKYGSTGFAGYDCGMTDGINENGLVANILFFKEAQYETTGSVNKPLLSTCAWVQWVLDRHSTVAEAVESMSAEPYRLVPPYLPNGRPGLAHLAISVAKGDSAIIEYFENKMSIYHDRKYTMLTNSPNFEATLAIDNYWRKVNGKNFLPGGAEAADRFTRTGYFLDQLPRILDERYTSMLPARTLQAQATAAVMSIMHVSIYPLGYTKPEEINTSSTIWKVVYDVTNMIIHYSSVGCPSTFQVNFKDLNLQEGAPTKMLLLKDGHCRSGTISPDAWNAAEPFVYCPYKP